MKNILLSAIFIFSLVFTTNAQLKTPQPSPFSKIEQKVGVTDVTLEFSRPGMKGRTIFGDLVPYEKVWRTGANSNSKITFSDDVTIDGKSLKKGTYALYTIPNKESWEIIFYSDSDNWGNPEKWDDAKVALKTTSKVENLDWDMETFTMGFGNLTNDSAVLDILWERSYVGVKIEVPTNKNVMKDIETMMAGPSANDYAGAANFYLATDQKLNEALTYMNKALEKGGEKFWLLKSKSEIQAKLGDKKGAIKTAKRSLVLATEANYDAYIKMNNDNIAKWSK